ncbi:MAG: hypothetical protein IJ193_02875 [Bacilli bacterium]|nr:hypothetical protein [Bacilli bacterium]
MTLNVLMNVLIKFTIFFVVFLLILELISYIVLDLKSKNHTIEGARVHLFGLLMELDDFTILALDVLLVRFVFVIWTLFDKLSIGDFHIIILIAFTLLFGIFSKSIKNLVFESFNSFALYFALLASRILTNYLIEVRYEWYVYVGDILLKVFIIIYSTFFLLRNINSLIVKTRYIRRERNEESI